MESKRSRTARKQDNPLRLDESGGCGSSSDVKRAVKKSTETGTKSRVTSDI